MRNQSLKVSKKRRNCKIVPFVVGNACSRQMKRLKRFTCKKSRFGHFEESRLKKRLVIEMKSWQTESSEAKLQKQINKQKKKKERRHQTQTAGTDKRQGYRARHGRIRTKQYIRHRNGQPVSIGNLCGPLKVTRGQ